MFARRRGARIDAKFSRYRPDSVVHALHASRGRPVEVDEETARLIEFGVALWEVSEGRFDLTSGVLRHAWHFEEGRVRRGSRADSRAAAVALAGSECSGQPPC